MPNSALAAQIVEHMQGRGLRLALAESLTGGALASAVVDVPGASAVLLGSIVAYDTALKSALLGVEAGLIERVGAVDREVALQMAAGARARLAAAAEVSAEQVIGLSCTGVAGPDAQDGKPVGLVFIATDSPGGPRVHEFQFAGTRFEIRSATVRTALRLLADQLDLRH
ncbi:MAG: hypothetical protein RL196_1453 [Actinomycetota bacterium]|jgi:nicotinamide-nucleotide amidase